MRKERINEIWGVLFLLLGLFSLASLLFFHTEDIPFYTSHPSSPVRNVTGVTGAYLAFVLFAVFGLSAFVIPMIFLLWSGCFFLQRVPEKNFFKFVGLMITLFASSTLTAISTEASLRLVRGGVVGYIAGNHLLRYFGYLGSLILVTSCLLLSVLLATDFLIYPIVKKLADGVRKKIGGFLENLELIWSAIIERIPGERSAIEKPVRFMKKPITSSSLPANIPLKVKQYRPDIAEVGSKDEVRSRDEIPLVKPRMPETVPPPREAKPKQERTESPPAKPSGDEASHFDGVISSKRSQTGGYRFPPLDLLRVPQRETLRGDDLKENSKILEETLQEFGIEVKVTEVEQGPVITRYEVMPAPGVKVNSIASLSDDIALALKAVSVRLIIPIPGKSAVGIEVPNSVISVVYLRELIETSLFRSRRFELPLVFGKDTSGKPLIGDLTSMPHILIAGTTGSGKTVCVNSLITGLLYYASPEDLKFVMIDPKRVELAVFNSIPHMLAPVVTDVRKAAHTLNWVVSEMENRYKLFATVGVRNIQTFNNRPISEEALSEIKDVKSENVIPAKLPYIVVVIDELADLMLVSQDKVEGALTRIAQLSRAVGIHMILATQRPSVDVITGVIKANFPARISFKVASKVDSRTVIDTIGADKLIGRGDLLLMQPGVEKLIRGQAPLVIDEEINRVVSFLANQGKPEYHQEILSAQEGKGLGGALEKDELFDEAVAIVLETGQASTSNLQRRLRLGYTRAARIIDQMEAEGIIGPQQGAKPREILVSNNPSEVASPEK
ncbi:MAG: DNA translocase FtsK [Candidatus Omnitrophica bacterium]|nr:DNA translocase FtsK [Candidatus Omnitrophota bacterium]